MATFPEYIMATQLKLYRGNGSVTVDEIVAEIMVRIAQEGWKFIPVTVDQAVLDRAEISKKQYALLYHALPER